jgi:hypothetical protein
LAGIYPSVSQETAARPAVTSGQQPDQALLNQALLNQALLNQALLNQALLNQALLNQALLNQGSASVKGWARGGTTTVVGIAASRMWAVKRPGSPVLPRMAS